MRRDLKVENKGPKNQSWFIGKDHGHGNPSPHGMPRAAGKIAESEEADITAAAIETQRLSGK